MEIYLGTLSKRVIAYAIVISILVISLTGCSKHLTNEMEGYSDDYMHDPDGLDATVVMQIRKDYHSFVLESLGGLYQQELSINTIWIQQYFGNYNGCEVLYMGSSLQYTSAERPETIGGYTIVFPSNQEVYAYNNGFFYTVKEAYEADLVFDSDIYSIGKQVDGGFAEQYPYPILP